MMVQIYSMTSIAYAVATAEAGAGPIGVVVAEPGIVPEGIGAEAAREVLAGSGRARAALLCRYRTIARRFVHWSMPYGPILCMWPRVRLSPRTACGFARVSRRLKLLRAIAVRAGETLLEADAHQEVADFLMLDSGAKGLPLVGAGGETHDWSVSRTIVERSRIPVILAGGLTADNVAEAIAAVRPWGVDSFTHTDLPGQRGKKDLARVRAFVAAEPRGFASVIESPPS